MLYRKKTFGVDAVQALRENWGDIVAMVGSDKVRLTKHPLYPERNLAEICRTSDGWVSLNPGEWVAMLEDGTITSFGDAEFRENFEPVELDDREIENFR